MKKIMHLGIVLGLLLSLAACQGAAEKWSENMQLALEAFGDSLRAFGELDVDSSEAEVSELVDELDASWAELQAAAESDGVDISPLEQAMDALEQALRSASGSGEPLSAQKEFLNAWFDAMSAFFDTLGS